MDVKKNLYELLLENANNKDPKIRKLCEKIENKLDEDDKSIDEATLKSWAEQLESLLPKRKKPSTPPSAASSKKTEGSEIRKRRKNSEDVQAGDEEEEPEKKIVGRRKTAVGVCLDLFWYTVLTLFSIFLVIRIIVVSLQFSGFLKSK